METRANHVLVGAFVLSILLAIFVAGIWVARVQFNREFSYYDIYFTGSVTGLNTGAPVRYNGVQIGRVDEIRIDPNNVEQVRVTIEVDGTIGIKEDAVASLELQGVTGYAFVQITGASQQAPPLKAREGQRYPVIASRPSRLEKVISGAPELLDRAIVIADRLADMLNDNNRAAIGESIENLRVASKALGWHSKDIETTIVDMAAAMRELRQMTASANEAVKGLDDAFGPKSGTGERLSSALTNLDQLTRRLNDTAGRVDAVVQENRPALKDFSQRSLGELSQLIADSRALIANLNRLTAEIERDPARFFFSDRREGYRPR
jgi:phospholipid/cholesterol/gamma-HCH transport system substrate-binding protein